ncbi:MAG: TlpA family protein disulfide reductase [Bacteriovoracia bacterium]
MKKSSKNRQKLPNTILQLIAVFTLCVLSVLYWFGSQPKQRIDWSMVQEKVGIYPSFSLESIDKKKVSLSDFSGKYVLVNFWATWCPPCIAELPSFIEFTEWAKKELGLITLAVSVDQQWDVVEKTLMKFSSSKHIFVLLDSTSETADRYGSSQFPETFLLDGNRKLIRKFVGPQSWNSPELKSWFKQIVGGAQKKSAVSVPES